MTSNSSVTNRGSRVYATHESLGESSIRVDKINNSFEKFEYSHMSSPGKTNVIDIKSGAINIFGSDHNLGVETPDSNISVLSSNENQYLAPCRKSCKKIEPTRKNSQVKKQELLNQSVKFKISDIDNSCEQRNAKNLSSQPMLKNK